MNWHDAMMLFLGTFAGVAIGAFGMLALDQIEQKRRARNQRLNAQRRRCITEIRNGQ